MEMRCIFRVWEMCDRWRWVYSAGARREPWFTFFSIIHLFRKMGKNKDRKKKGVAVQKTATKAKKKTEKELKKQIEQLGEVT